MSTLHPFGKAKVMIHHREVPYKMLEHGYGFSAEKSRVRQLSVAPSGSDP